MATYGVLRPGKPPLYHRCATRQGHSASEVLGRKNPSRVLWPRMPGYGRKASLATATSGIPQDPMCWPEVTPCVTFFLCHVPGMSALTQIKPDHPAKMLPSVGGGQPAIVQGVPNGPRGTYGKHAGSKTRAGTGPWVH